MPERIRFFSIDVFPNSCISIPNLAFIPTIIATIPLIPYLYGNTSNLHHLAQCPIPVCTCSWIAAQRRSRKSLHNRTSRTSQVSSPAMKIVSNDDQ